MTNLYDTVLLVLKYASLVGLALVVRRLGYRATYLEYEDDDFWEVGIEQPAV